MKFLKNISKEDVLKLPLIKYQGEIIVVDSFREFNKYIDKLYSESVWGFDTETKPSFKKGASNQNVVSLLQLSSENIAFLFRLNKIGLPDELLNFLTDEKFTKVGLAIKDDIKMLNKREIVNRESFIDLQSIASDYGIEELSLRKLSAIVLGKRVSKNQQMSNWDADLLSEKQIIYAATDAWVCYMIYKNLINSGK